jgi:DNA-binding NarL/FixJ family response regulator
MPAVTGLELLKWVKGQAEFTGIPFVMLSHSKAEQDMEEAQRMGVDAYRCKSDDLEAMRALAHELSSTRML